MFLQRLVQRRNRARKTAIVPNDATPGIGVSRENLFYKSFAVAGSEGWYLEFGCFKGSSFIQAYRSAKQLVDEMLGGSWDDGLGRESPDRQRSEQKSWVQRAWGSMRFVAFDSFNGIPEHQCPIDRHYNVFPGGAYSCTKDQFLGALKKAGVDESRVIVVPGFFDQTLNQETANAIGLTHIAVVHIDSDLYESAKMALDFCTPYLRDGSIVIFDEWFQFRGNPFLGEQRAFSEWREEHPDWTVTEFGTSGPWSKAFILSLKPQIMA